MSRSRFSGSPLSAKPFFNRVKRAALFYRCDYECKVGDDYEWKREWFRTRNYYDCDFSENGEKENPLVCISVWNEGEGKWDSVYRPAENADDEEEWGLADEDESQTKGQTDASNADGGDIDLADDEEDDGDEDNDDCDYYDDYYEEEEYDECELNGEYNYDPDETRAGMLDRQAEAYYTGMVEKYLLFRVKK